MKRKVLIEIPADDRVDVMADKYGAQPCLAGRRFPLAQVLAELGEGSSYSAVEELSIDYDLPEEQVRGALLWCAEVMAQSFTATEGDAWHLLGDMWVVKDKTTGWWWRPKACGYTQEVLAAGVVDEKTAQSWAHRRSPDRNGNYTDEAFRLPDVIKNIGDGSVMRAILDLVPEIPMRHDLESLRRRVEQLEVKLEVAGEDKRKLSEQGRTYRERAEDAEAKIEEARAAAEEIRDAWVPKEKHTEFPWEM
jgi:uncharacterized protein (DUF433 family)